LGIRRPIVKEGTMTHRNARLTVEALGERVVPSAARPVAPESLPPVKIVQITHPLTGRGTGDYHSKRTNPATGTTHTPAGTRHLQGMGDVKVAGTIHGPGFINSQTFTGTLTFWNAKGRVTVELTSFRPVSLAGLPVWYRYHVVQATGAYKGMKDTG